eukprot:COSAG02_NODE_18325_length_945_cov_1.517730_1_plen_142_part_00
MPISLYTDMAETLTAENKDILDTYCSPPSRWSWRRSGIPPSASRARCTTRRSCNCPYPDRAVVPWGERAFKDRVAFGGHGLRGSTSKRRVLELRRAGCPGWPDGAEGCGRAGTGGRNPTAQKSTACRPAKGRVRMLRPWSC